MDLKRIISNQNLINLSIQATLNFMDMLKIKII